MILKSDSHSWVDSTRGGCAKGIHDTHNANFSLSNQRIATTAENYEYD